MELSGEVSIVGNHMEHASESIQHMQSTTQQGHYLLQTQHRVICMNFCMELFKVALVRNKVPVMSALLELPLVSP